MGASSSVAMAEPSKLGGTADDDSRSKEETQSTKRPQSTGAAESDGGGGKKAKASVCKVDAAVSAQDDPFSGRGAISHVSRSSAKEPSWMKDLLHGKWALCYSESLDNDLEGDYLFFDEGMELEFTDESRITATIRGGTHPFVGDLSMGTFCELGKEEKRYVWSFAWRPSEERLPDMQDFLQCYAIPEGGPVYRYPGEAKPGEGYIEFTIDGSDIHLHIIGIALRAII